MLEITADEIKTLRLGLQELLAADHLKDNGSAFDLDELMHIAVNSAALIKVCSMYSGPVEVSHEFKKVASALKGLSHQAAMMLGFVAGADKTAKNNVQLMIYAIGLFDYLADKSTEQKAYTKTLIVIDLVHKLNLLGYKASKSRYGFTATFLGLIYKLAGQDSNAGNDFINYYEIANEPETLELLHDMQKKLGF